VPTAERAAPLAETEAAALFADLADHSALVLAVSGGPDSTALLVLAARWRASVTHGPALVAVTVDHGLRPESAREAVAVKRLAASLGVPHRTLHWTGQKPVTGLPESARAARYRLLAAAAHEAGARAVLTAHTRDDQAETVLMRMARGSGPAGLAGMARVSPRRASGGGDMTLIRPFLDVPKARLVATLEASGIAFADDPSNRDPRFTRARLRALLPALAAEGLDAGRLATLARRLARAEAALEAAVDAAFSRLRLESSLEQQVVLDACGFAALPAEIALRLLGRTIARSGDEGLVELGKLESLFAALVGAIHRNDPGRRFRRTLAGALVTGDAHRLVVERAPARRRRIEASQARRAPTMAWEASLRDASIVKEINLIPLADGPGGPTLAEGKSRPPRIASAILTAGSPARRKGRQ